MAAQMGLPFSLSAVGLVGTILARMSLVVVAIIIFWRRSDDWVAMMLSGSLLTVLIEGGFQNIGLLKFLNAGFLTIGAALFYPLPFIFPNGRIEPRRLGWLIVPLLIVVSLETSAPYLTIGLENLTVGLTLIWSILAVYAMTYRYLRVSNALERQQTKWVLVGLSMILVIGLDWTLGNLFFPISQPSPARIVALFINMALYLGCYGFFAFSMLVAMLRYRLWDIDLIIRRTLVYSVLTGILALTYFGSIVLLQNILVGVTGQAQSQLVTVFSTLTIAALFFPLRRRVQNLIDRGFYRRKYDAAKTLEAFAATARDETDLDQLTARLAGVVEETMQPKGVGVWLKVTAQDRPSANASESQSLMSNGS